MLVGMKYTILKRKVLIILDFKNYFFPTYLQLCKNLVPWNHFHLKYALDSSRLKNIMTLWLAGIEGQSYKRNANTTLRQNGLLPRKNVREISTIVQETTCPQGLRTGFG